MMAQSNLGAETYETSTVSDYDGNVYTTVKIGNKWWMAENLRTTHYYDGTSIPLSTVTKTVSADDYKDYYLYPNNDINNVGTYGLLYSWSVTTTNTLLPSSWTLADTTAWAELATYVGGAALAGGKLKSTSELWTSPNTDADNGFNFNALPAGDCNTGGFTQFGTQARFWTPQGVDVGGAGRVYMLLSYNSAALSKGQYRNVNAMSLRFVKDVETATESINSSEKAYLQNTVVSNELIVNNVRTGSQLKVYALNGSLLKTTNADDNQQMRLSVNELSQGIYVLAVENNSMRTRLKFIKN
ncbi:MAG: FISUMP domain-containing protein [Selenomonadaceae bacterium]